MDTPPPEEPARTAGRNLPVAVASGLALAGIFLGTLFAHPVAFLAFVAVLIVIALLELDVAIRATGVRPATPVAIGAGLVMFGGTYTHGPSAHALGLVLLVLGTMTWSLFDSGSRPAPARRRGVAASVGATFFMTLWVPFLASFFGLLLARGPDGLWLVIAVIALSALNDIGAYAAGVRFGRHKLAPSVSPAKTWEGFAGGFVTTIVVAAGIVAHLPGLDMTTALVLAPGVALASTVGDLTESLVKRDLGVKDLGRIVPGHGGIMDRADAIIFSLPVAHLLLLALGR
jgi:phosphatidate cytidylyltransferase